MSRDLKETWEWEQFLFGLNISGVVLS
jgi:hypothetical protein